MIRTYANPVYPGDFPDPSVVRVGSNDFWATTTSTEWAPQFPILHSRDLVNWRIVGAVFPEPPAWAAGKFWAPEISFYNGTYFVYYVAEDRGGTLNVAVATAAKPEGPYTDRGPLIGQGYGSIDPTPVTGEDGHRYLIWKEDGNSVGCPTVLWVQRLDESGTRLIDEPHEIMRNDVAWERNVVEGPSVVRRDDWFYLFYSGGPCCGRKCNYAVGVARSRSILGPWEKYERNPILATNEYWRCPGHGSVVDTGDGRTFFLYHAYDVKDSIFVGRQALLDEITWSQGWPQINGGEGPSREAASPFGIMKREPRKSTSEAFLRKRLSLDWQWPHERKPVVEFARGVRRGIVLGASAAANDDDIAGVLARHSTSGDYTATAAIDLTSLGAGIQASLCAYGDHENALGIGVRDGVVLLWKRVRGKHRSTAAAAIAKAKTLYVRMRVTDGRRFEFFLSRDGRHWQPAHEDAKYANFLVPWDRGVRLALAVGGEKDAARKAARFKWLQVVHAARKLTVSA
ncbi:MAG: family 43 glycosylhydrolase [Candidatus Eremiobacteraeota bacterium]|nr:family 43 glycosylhydrolase [Candidatus Eremiobacteraeota bacterium]